MDKRVDNRLDNSWHVIEQISAYLDGALDDAVSDDVRAHIDSCTVCHVEYVEVRATRSLLKRVPAVMPPRAFTLTPEMVGRKVWLWERLLVPRNVPRLATGSALAFAMVVLLLVGNLSNMSLSLNFAPQASIVTSKAAEVGSREDMMSDIAATPGDTDAAGISGGAELTAGAQMNPVMMPTPVSLAARPIMPAATSENLDNAMLPAPVSTQAVPPATGGGDASGVAQSTSEALADATRLPNGFIESQPTAAGSSFYNVTQQPSSDGGQVLFLSLTGLMVAIGAAFAVGAVFAARR